MTTALTATSVLESWEGCIGSIDGDLLYVDLISDTYFLTHPDLVEYCTLQRNMFSAADQSRIAVGALFYMTVRQINTYQYVTLQMQNLGVWTQEEIDECYRKADERYSG